MPQIFKGALSASFVATQPIMIVGSTVALQFDLAVATAVAEVEWYLEFTDQNPSSGTWYREVAEEDNGQGEVLMPFVVRTFADNSGTDLAVGTHHISTQFVRREKFARVQIRRKSGGGGTCDATVTASSGDLVVA